MTKEVWALGALDLAERIAAKEISSREVIGAHLARIEAVNPAVNAVTVPLVDEAMAAAAAADQAIAAGHSLGPLHGVPFTIKENLLHRPSIDSAQRSRAARDCAWRRWLATRSRANRRSRLSLRAGSNLGPFLRL